MFVEIYGTTTCPFCVKAKDECIKREIEYKYILVNKEVSKEEVVERIGADFSTVPQIFVDDKHIGGCDDFLIYLEQKQDLSDEDFSDFSI